MSKRLIVDVLLVILFIAGLYYASSMPYEKQDLRGTIDQIVDADKVKGKMGDISFYYGSKEISVDEVGVAGFVEFFIRKLTHFTIFALVTYLLFRVLRHLLPLSAAIPWSGFVGIWIAVLDEWHQSFTPNRTSMVADVILDGSGVVFSLLLILLVTSTRRRRKSFTNTR